MSRGYAWPEIVLCFSWGKAATTQIWGDMAERQNSHTDGEQQVSRHGRPVPAGGGKAAITRGRVIAAVIVIVVALLTGVGGVLLLTMTPVSNSGLERIVQTSIVTNLQI